MEKKDPFWKRSRKGGIFVASRFWFLLKVALGVFLAIYFVVAATFLSVRYLILPNIDLYRAKIEKLASESVGSSVTFSQIKASWYGLQPKIDLENVRIFDSQGNDVVRLENVSAVVSWWSVPLMDVRLDLLRIDGPDIDITRDAEGHVYVAGIQLDSSESEKSGVADWILKQHEIVVLNGQLHWKDALRHDVALTLNQVNFALLNQGTTHRFRLMATPDIELAHSLDVRGNLSHSSLERPSDIFQWKGELYMAMPGVDISKWKAFIDFPIELDNGYGAAQVWMTLDDGQLAELTADVDGKQIQLKMDETLPLLDLRHMTGRFSVKKVHDEQTTQPHTSLPVYAYAIHDLSLETESGKRLNETSLSLMYIPGETRLPNEIKLEIEKLDIDELKDFLPYIPIAQDIRQEIDKYDVSGKLSQFLLQWKGLSENNISYRVKGNFNGLTFREKKGVESTSETIVSDETALPFGIENLDGSVSASEKEGSLKLASERSTLVLPLYSRESPQQFDKLDAQLQWKRTDDNVMSIDILALSFLQDSMKVSVSGHYKRDLNDEKNRYGFIDATANIENLNIADVKKYIPLQTSDALNAWLSKALKGGRVSEGTVQIKGNLADFPYTQDNATGLFTVKAKLVDGALNYTPNMFSQNGKQPLWPDIEKIQGEFSMKGSMLAIHADTALTNNVDLKDVDVVIPDVLSDTPLLDIKGRAEGALQNQVGFVNVTPVTQWIGRLTEKTRTTGNANLALRLQIPLDKPERATVNGTLQFNDNDIVLLEDLPVVAGTRGQLYFSEKGFRLEKIRGAFLNEPVTLSGGTQQNGHFLVRAEGVLSGKGLQKTYTTGFLGKLMGSLSGSTSYAVAISNSEIGIESDLKGLKVGLPAPLGKPAENALPLHVKFKDRPSSKQVVRDEIDIAYGPNMTARYLRQKGKRGGWHIVQGGIGINRPLVLKEGLSLSLSLHHLDLNAWYDVLKNFSSGSGEGTSVSLSPGGLVSYIYPHYFSIETDEMVALDLWLTRLRLNGAHQAKVWNVDIASEQINGQMKWIEGSKTSDDSKLVARLKSLNVLQSSLTKISDMTGKENIYWIPSLDVVADDLTLFGKHLGKAEIVANNAATKNGREWRINRLKITNPDAVLESSGSWVTTASKHQQTKLDYVLNIKDAGKLLARLGYDNLIKRGEGEMKGHIGWNGVPFVLDFPSLSGQIALKVENGQFLKADPGMARLLSVVSLQSLPRRLNLDFRDVFSKGFAFDEITENATIANGVIKTENLKMNGVNATVIMKGQVDIVKESQNLLVVVIPEINAAAASIAYGFINPVIGIGTFLAQMFLREPLMKQFTHQYQITGSWSNPVIVEVKGKEGLENGQSGENEQ